MDLDISISTCIVIDIYIYVSEVSDKLGVIISDGQ
uniref:Uncharacterized protein n=1 Tax=Anguilla anguilla TaxID=7936 RepID=A0A0E9Q690_ANGAN